VAVAATCAALFLQGSKKNVFDTLQSVGAFFAPPMAAMFLLGIAWKRVTATAVKVNIWLGSIISLSIGVMSVREWPEKIPVFHNGLFGTVTWEPFVWPHFMLLAFSLFVFCFSILVIVSLLTKHSDYEEDIGAAQRLHQADTTISEAARHGAGLAGWLLWGLLAIIMVSLYIGFQYLSHTV
jgi:SSS family solute:Na+ symporter